LVILSHLSTIHNSPSFTGFCPNSACNNGICSLGNCICHIGWSGTTCDYKLTAPVVLPLPDVQIAEGALFISDTPIVVKAIITLHVPL
jgi:hypothetical protein